MLKEKEERQIPKDTQEDAKKLLEYRKNISPENIKILFNDKEVQEKLLEWVRRTTSVEDVIYLLDSKLKDKSNAI